MAMMPRRDRSAYYNSLQSNSDMAMAEARAHARADSAANDTTIDRLRVKESEQRTQNMIQGVQNVVSGFTNLIYAGKSGDLSPIVGDKINSLIQDSQTEQANAELWPMLTEGNRIAQESLASGASRYHEIETFDADGNSQGTRLVFTPGDDLQRWYDDAMASVDGMSYLPSVKSKLRVSLTDSYYGQVMQLQGDAIEKAYNDLEAAYSTNLEASLVSDSQLYRQYDGNLPEGINYSGIAAIARRSDFSDARKQAEAVNYLEQVRYLGIQDKATQLARTEGMAAADEYIQSQSSLSARDRISVTALAQQAYNQMEGIYTDTADSLMTEAFTSGGSTPSQVHKEINDIGRSQNLPRSVVNKMHEKARETQRNAVQKMVSNTIQSDANEGYSALIDGLDYIESGKADAWFYGIPEEKEAAIAGYNGRIAKVQEELAKSLGAETEAVQKMDANLLTGYKTGLDNDWNLFTTGAIVGDEYMDSVARRTTEARKAANLPETEESIIAAQSVAMDKILGYIPSAYKTDIEGTVENLLIAEGRIASQKSKRTPEEWNTLYRAITATNGAIADAIYQYGAGTISSPEDIFNYANKTAQAFILENEVLGSDGVSDIPLATQPGITMKEVITAAVETNTTIVDSGESNYVYLDHSAGYDPLAVSDEEGGVTGIIPRYLASGEVQAFPEYRFISAGAQEDYNRRADVFRSQLAMAMGIDESQIRDNPEASGTGDTAIASPIMFTGGRVFRVRGYTIQETENGSTWEPFAKINKNGIPELINPEPEPQSNDVDAGNSGRTGITRDNIQDYIKPQYEITRAGRQLTGVTIDPAILQAGNYTRTDVINIVKDTPELEQVWQMVARQLGELEEGN